jgi:hypothetical protein
MAFLHCCPKRNVEGNEILETANRVQKSVWQRTRRLVALSGGAVKRNDICSYR